ncbi:hypothetical protein [Streptomyces sp. NPDC054834]
MSTTPLVTDWIGAWSMAGAAIGTVAAFFTGFVLLRNEVARDRKQKNLERRGQARLVHGYATWQESVRLGAAWIREGYAYVIENNSDEPIYEVEIPRDLENTATRYGMIVAKGKQIQPMTDNEVRSLGLADASRARDDLATTGVHVSPVVFSFTDAATVRWTRDSDGRLSECS